MTTFGKFALKKEEDEELDESLDTSSTFQRWKLLNNSKSDDGENATTPTKPHDVTAAASRPVDSARKQQQSRKKRSSPVDKLSVANKQVTSIEAVRQIDKNDNATVDQKPHRKDQSPSKEEGKPAQKASAAVARKTKPFSKLLQGVIFTISGIENPERAELRGKALAMGATYKGDWSQDCTHLICPFQNTPKVKKARGQGKIVTPNWIEKCHDEKKYLPWRRYALEKVDQTAPESDEEIFAEDNSENKTKSRDKPSPATTKRTIKDPETVPAPKDTTFVARPTPSVYDDSTDEEVYVAIKKDKIRQLNKK